MTNITFDGPIEPGAESLVKTARLFYVGRHNGRDYSIADLTAIVSNFTADSRVPVQIDHSLSARDTVGIVRKIWLSNDGSEILGEIEILGRENVDRVRLGLWKQVSVGLNINEPDMIMYEVSVTPFPALKDAQIFKIEEKSKGEPEKMSDKKATVEVETVNMA